MTAPQRSPEWHAERKGRLTSSLAGAALGLAPYMSEEDAKRALVRSMHDMPSEFEGNIATDWGVANEDLAKAAYEIATGHKVEPAGFVKFAEWSGASPDGYVGDNGLLEIKCPFGIRKDEWPNFKPIEDQPHYYAQMQIQMLVTGRIWCDFFQWTPAGTDLERVLIDHEWIGENIPKLASFWLAAKGADPDDYKGPKRPVIDTPEAKRLIAEYDELKDAIDNAKERMKEIVERCVEISNWRDAVVSGRNLTLAKKKGSVSYAKALSDLAPGADLEPYRGNPSESWQIK